MTGVLGPRLVLVTRETEYDELLVRHATRGQATAFLRRRGQTLEGLDRQREALSAMVSEIRGGVPKGWRIAAVRRAELDRFLFAPEDVVVAVGQDGLVANLAKYLRGQPVIGVNADPTRNPGVLVPHRAADVARMLPLAAAGTIGIDERTMIHAEVDDGQVLLALNEVFVGHASHQSARYSIAFGGREEVQSSSGLIVATGTGATGWALSIARATGVSIVVSPEEQAGLFLVREPWPSVATGASIVSGRLGGADRLVVVSRMNEGGVVFADGMERDRLDFGWGRTLTLRIAAERLRFVPGAGPSAVVPRAPPVRRTARASGRDAVPPPRPTVSTPVGDGQVAVQAAPRRRLGRLRLVLLLLLGAVVFGAGQCSELLHPSTEDSAVVVPGR